MKTRLTQLYVSNLKPPQKAYWITDEGCPNLRLHVGTSSKVWYVCYREDGDIRKKSYKLGTTQQLLSVAFAREAAADFLHKLKKGETPQKKKAPEKLTLRDFLKNYYEPWILTNHRSGKQTLSMLRAAFKDFLNTPICDLRIKDVDKWRQERLKSGTKTATCNRRITELKAALSWGLKLEHIKENPLTKLEKLKEHDSEAKIRYLTDEERERLMNAIDAREKRIRAGRASHNEWLNTREYEAMPELSGEFADYLKPMILISLQTGIRQGSLFSLRWSDIDFVSQTFQIRPVSNKPGKLLNLPMNSKVVSVLSAWKEQNSYTGPDDLVFPSPVTGNRLSNVKIAWSGILKYAGIQNFRWHDMRHDFASQLVMKGVDLNTVRELMGHAEMKMTLRYAHLAPKNKLRAAEVLAKI
jgi:integrase